MVLKKGGLETQTMWMSMRDCCQVILPSFCWWCNPLGSAKNWFGWWDTSGLFSLSLLKGKSNSCFWFFSLNQGLGKFGVFYFILTKTTFFFFSALIFYFKIIVTNSSLNPRRLLLLCSKAAIRAVLFFKSLSNKNKHLSVFHDAERWPTAALSQMYRLFHMGSCKRCAQAAPC